MKTKTNSDNGGFFADLGRYCARHALSVVMLWGVLFLIAVVLYLTMFSKNMTTTIKFTTGLDSQLAENLFADRFPYAARSLETCVISSNRYTTDQPEFWNYVDNLWTQKLAALREQGVVLDAQYNDPVMREWMPMVPAVLEDMAAAARAVLNGAPSEELIARSDRLKAASTALRAKAQTFQPEALSFAGNQALIQGGQAVDGSAEIAGTLLFADAIEKVYGALYPMTQGEYLTAEVREAKVAEMKAMVARLSEMGAYLEATGPGTADRPTMLDGIKQFSEQGPLLAAMYEAKWASQLGIRLVDALTAPQLPTVAEVDALVVDMQDTAARLTSVIAYIEQNVPQSDLRDSTLAQLRSGASQYQMFGATLMPILSKALALAEGDSIFSGPAEAVLKFGLSLASGYMNGMKATAQNGLAQIQEQTNAQIGQVVEGRVYLHGMLTTNLPTLEAAPQMLKDGMAMIEGTISPDKNAIIFIMQLSPDKDEAAKHIYALRDATLTGDGKGIDPNTTYEADGFRVRMIGLSNQNQDMQDVALNDLVKSLSIAVPISLVILFMVFGTLGAALLPLVLSVMVIVIALGVCALLGLWVQVAFAIQNIVALLGLALGIDHALFIAYRYREERRKGRDKMAAIARANSTAGHAIFWAGVVVIISFLGIMIIPSSMHRSLGIGAFTVLFVIIPASLTLLPAMLSLLGNGFDFGRLPWQKRITDPLPVEDEQKKDFWHWITRPAMVAPIISFILGTALLAVVISPYFKMKLSYTSVEALPPDSVSKSGLMAIEQANFPVFGIFPLNIAISGYDKPLVKAETAALIAEMQASGQFYTTVPIMVNEEGDVAYKMATLLQNPFTEEAADVVRHLRSDMIGDRFKAIGGEAHVAGAVPMFVDFYKINADYMDPILLFILGLRLLLLFFAFRSVLVSVFLTVASVLSLYAGYGMIVWVFQGGHGFGIYQKVAGIDPYTPFFLMCGLLGISMDFLVFMISRVRERYDQTGNPPEAIMHAFRRVGFVVMGAAAVMAVIFFAFSISKILTVAELGFGMTIAMLVDATLVNFLMSPAVLKILGKWMWWWPSWLNWAPDWRAHPGTDEVAPEENVFSPDYRPAGVPGYAAADLEEVPPHPTWRS